MKNTFANWRSCEKKRKTFTCRTSTTSPIPPLHGCLSAPMTSRHELFWNPFCQLFTTNFCCAEWIQFFLIIFMEKVLVCVCAGQPHAYTFNSSFQSGRPGLLATIARPHPRSTVSQVADAFTHTSLPVPLALPPPVPQPMPHPLSTVIFTSHQHPPTPTASRLLSVTSELYLPGSHPPAPPYPESAFRVLQTTGLQCQSNLNWKSKSTRLRDIDWLS